MNLPVQLHGIEVVLLPRALRIDGALYLADLHLGTDLALRREGRPVPDGADDATLMRLERLLQEHRDCDELVVLGDFLHTRQGVDPRLRTRLQQLRRRWPRLSISLVQGNHDPGHLPPSWRIQVIREHRRGGVLGLHDPAAADDESAALILAGHLHPGISIAGRGDRLRLPCFCLRGRCLILPAFGSTTGLALLEPAPSDRIWALAGDQVLPLPASR